jgi:hypothetical protein
MQTRIGQRRVCSALPMMIPGSRGSDAKPRRPTLILLEEMEAAIGFEPMHGGFADLSLNHLGTPPCLSRSRGRTRSNITREQVHQLSGLA